MRGVDILALGHGMPINGTSPHVRSGRRGVPVVPVPRWNISACAERTCARGR